VQEETIPIALTGAHILARAKNGTGKTASYLVPILNQIDTTKPYIQGLVLAPTRELVIQTSGVAKSLGEFMNVEVMTCIGGTKVADDLLRLKQNVHLLVATLGRLNYLCKRGECDLSRCKIIAIDEADKLLAEEFVEDVEELLTFVSPERQILLFSATFPSSIEQFQKKYIPDAHFANLMEELTLKGVTQYYAFVQEKQKLQCVMILFSMLEINQAVIFCNSVNRVELLANHIIKTKTSCMYVHARMDQETRNKVFHDFKENKARILVASGMLPLLSIN
jgi:ATP-dependent RNA helicase DDX6/DHH1